MTATTPTPDVAPGASRAARLGAWMLWAVAVVGLVAGITTLDHLLRPLGAAFLTELAVAPTLACVSAATVGAIVAGRRPAHPVGWWLLGLAISLMLSGIVAGVVQYGAVTRSMDTPPLGLAARCYPATVVWAFVCLGLVLHLTPTGAPAIRRWRPWVRGVPVVVAATTVAGLVLPVQHVPSASLDNPFDLRWSSGPLLVTNRVAIAVALLTVCTGAMSLIGRFRRATGGEQQQLRWLALAAVLTAACMGVVGVASVAGAIGIVGWAGAIGVVLLPPTIGAAILRYRLYQVDRVISRVVTYGALSVLLGALSAIVVIAPAQVLGRRSDLAVAAATLAVAAAFRPLRRRIQHAVDRRFNRARYDAQTTLGWFAAVLRRELDPAVVRSALSTVVHNTVQPARATLWLAPRATGHALPTPALDAARQTSSDARARGRGDQRQPP